MRQVVLVKHIEGTFDEISRADSRAFEGQEQLAQLKVLTGRHGPGRSGERVSGSGSGICERSGRFNVRKWRGSNAQEKTDKTAQDG